MRSRTLTLRRLSIALFAFAILVSAPTYAQMALITVEPNNFASGQDISTATTGAKLLAFSEVPNPNPNFDGSFVPQYLPVFAQPVSAGCTFGDDVPCGLNGNLLLGNSPTTGDPVTFWGEENQAVGCLIEFQQSGLCDPSDLPEFPVLRVNFTVPTNLVTAEVGVFDEDPAIIEAFNSSGQSLGQCQIAPTFITPAGCATLIEPIGTEGFGWGQLTISRPSADISYVLIGGLGNIRPAARVQFNSPVPIQLVGLLQKSHGVGPGASLELQALIAGVYYAVRDTRATCAVLNAYAHEVNAQSGKHIGSLQALQLLGIVKPIEAAIGCH